MNHVPTGDAYLGERPSFTFAFRDTVTVVADATVLDLLRSVVVPESAPAELVLAGPSSILRFRDVVWVTRAWEGFLSTNLRFFTDPVPTSRSAALRLTVDVPAAGLVCLRVACSFFQLLERVVVSIARGDQVCHGYCMPGRKWRTQKGHPRTFFSVGKKDHRGHTACGKSNPQPHAKPEMGVILLCCSSKSVCMGGKKTICGIWVSFSCRRNTTIWLGISQSKDLLDTWMPLSLWGLRYCGWGMIITIPTLSA